MSARLGCLARVLVLLGWAAAGAAALPRPARSCDACLEDKIAATYDWQVVTSSRQRGHTVVFTALRGPVRPGDERRAGRLARAVEAAAGADPGTVRVSLSPPAVSFACDPARALPARRIAAANRRLRPLGLSLALVRVGAPGLATAGR